MTAATPDVEPAWLDSSRTRACSWLPWLAPAWPTWSGAGRRAASFTAELTRRGVLHAAAGGGRDRQTDDESVPEVGPSRRVRAPGRAGRSGIAGASTGRCAAHPGLFWAPAAGCASTIKRWQLNPRSQSATRIGGACAGSAIPTGKWPARQDGGWPPACGGRFWKPGTTAYRVPLPGHVRLAGCRRRKRGRAIVDRAAAASKFGAAQAARPDRLETLTTPLRETGPGIWKREPPPRYNVLTRPWMKTISARSQGEKRWRALFLEWIPTWKTRSSGWSFIITW